MLRHWTPVLCLLALGLFGPDTLASSAGEQRQTAEVGGAPNAPRRHFRTRRPARLAPSEAEEMYRQLADALRTGYALADHPVARDYRGWRRFNSAPYLSAAHGNLYINNYANESAQAYGHFESAGKMPVGAIIAKDSFIVERDGTVRPGPLFIMEKMPKGFNYVSGDWRYTQIMPDGAFFGETLGRGTKRVEFCIACHLAVERQDHLFFVPAANRVAPWPP
jgi:hypothetical protein